MFLRHFDVFWDNSYVEEVTVVLPKLPSCHLYWTVGMFFFYFLFSDLKKKKKSPHFWEENSYCRNLKVTKTNSHTNNRTQLFRERCRCEYAAIAGALSLWGFGTMLKGTLAVLWKCAMHWELNQKPSDSRSFNCTSDPWNLVHFHLAPSWW